MGQNALCQSDCSIFKRTKSPEEINKIAWFFACQEMKFWSIIFWLEMAKNGCSQSGYETLKLNVSQEWTVEINVSQECTVGINWFLHDATDSGKFKVDSIIFV